MDPLRASSNVIRTLAPLPSAICSPLISLTTTVFLATSSPSLFVGLRKTNSNYLLSTGRKNTKEHKHNNDDDDDPKDSADRGSIPSVASIRASKLA
jgi:hypothetical protein